MRISKMRALGLALCAPLWLSVGAVSAQAPGKPAAKPMAVAKTAPVVAPALVRELGGIEEYRLPNGLQILLFPDEAQSTTTVNITYRVGSRYEAPGEYGMAHLLEHMVFKGTPSHRDIPDEFGKRGMRWNGTTTTDRTNYFSSFNANDETLDFALKLEADRMLNSFIAKADLDKEMSVVRNEFERGENDAFQVLNQRTRAIAYNWHPYGKVTIGPKSDIENVPIEKLQAFYKRYYRPDNATLLVAGRFDKAKTLALIGRYFAPLKHAAAPIPQPYTVEPAQDGERSVVVRRVGGQTMLLALYHVPAVSHADTAAVLVYGLLMSLQPSGQIYKQLVETKLAVAAGLGGIGDADPGLAMAFAVLPPDADVAKVEQQWLDLVEGRSIKPFDESELARVREMAAVSYREQMKNPEGLIQQISSLIGSGDWRLIFQLMEDIPKVTLADVERVRQAYFRSANRSLGRYLPATQVERVEIPAAPPLAERLAALKPPPKVEEGERFDPTPAHLEARMQRLTLPSGIELHSLRKQTRGNTVQLQMQLQWGERRATAARRGAGWIDDILFEGSQGYTKQQIQDELLKLKAGLNISGGPQGASITLSAEKDTLLPALKIVADVLQHPVWPEAAYERLQKAQIASLEGARHELYVLLMQAIREHINTAYGVQEGDPDYMRSIDQNLARMRATTLDDLRSFYADYWSANEARVTVVGAAPEGLDQAIEQLFGAWKKPQAARFVRHVQAYRALPAASFRAPAPDKPNALVQFMQNLKVSRRDPDHAALALAVHVLGGGALGNRLATRVRQQEGLSYGIQAQMSVPDWGDEGGLYITGSFAPDKRERIVAVVQEELKRFNDEGITEAELARAKKDMLEARSQARASEGELAGTMQSLAEHHESWAQEQMRDEQLAALTVEQVNTAWRRVVRLDAFVITTVGDFKDSP